MMRTILLWMAAVALTTTGFAQIPMPGYYLSEMMEAQAGVANYSNEKFDFDRLPASRSISRFLHLTDTITREDRVHIFRTRLLDNEGTEVAQLTFQSQTQVTRKDTVTFVSVHNRWLKVVTIALLAADAPETEVERAIDSLQNLRTLPDGSDILPADQDALCYALQYLFARNGIDASPIFNRATYLTGENKSAVVGYCCDKAQDLKIGSDIERFARRAKFSEEYIYVCMGPNAKRNFNVVFFYCDGKFWTKIGPTQYLTFDSVISVWRHYKDADRIVGYKLKKRFKE